MRAMQKRTIRDKRHQQLVKLLKEERIKAGILQKQLANRMRQCQTWVVHLEKSRRHVRLLEFIDLAKVVGFNPYELLEIISKLPSSARRVPKRSARKRADFREASRQKRTDFREASHL